MTGDGADFFPVVPEEVSLRPSHLREPQLELEPGMEEPFDADLNSWRRRAAERTRDSVY